MERILSHTCLLALIVGAIFATADDKNFKPFYKVHFEDKDKDKKLGNAIGLHVKVTADKGFIVAGKRKVDNNRWDAFLAKYGANQELDWVQTYGTAEDDEAIFVNERTEQDKVVGYIIFGNTTSDKTNPYAWARNTDEKGVIIKDGGRKDFDDIAYDAQKIVHVSHVPSDGVKTPDHYLIAGTVKAIDRPLPNAWIARVDAFGKIQKERKFGYEEKSWGMAGAFVGRVSPTKVVLITNSSPREDGFGRVDHFLMDENDKTFSWKAPTDAEKALLTSEDRINNETEAASKATAATMTSDGNTVIAVGTIDKGVRVFSLVKVDQKGKVLSRSTKLVNDEKDRVVTRIIESQNENKELILVGSVAETRKVYWKEHNYSDTSKEEVNKTFPQFWVSRMTQHLRLKWNRTLQSKTSDFFVSRDGASPLDIIGGTAYGIAETPDHETIVVGSANRGRWDKPRNGNYIRNITDPMSFLDEGDFLKVVGATCEGNCHK